MKLGAWSAPLRPTSRYSGSPHFWLWAYSCNAVFASGAGASAVPINGDHRRPTAVSAASAPPSIRIAPRSASHASARITSFFRPPERASLAAMIRCGPSCSRRAISAHEALQTSALRCRASSTSRAWGKRTNKSAAMAKPKTRSPRNSRRSLSLPPFSLRALEWIRASVRRPLSLNV